MQLHELQQTSIKNRGNILPIDISYTTINDTETAANGSNLVFCNILKKFGIDAKPIKFEYSQAECNTFNFNYSGSSDDKLKILTLLENSSLKFGGFNNIGIIGFTSPTFSKTIELAYFVDYLSSKLPEENYKINSSSAEIFANYITEATNFVKNTLPDLFKNAPKTIDLGSDSGNGLNNKIPASKLPDSGSSTSPNTLLQPKTDNASQAQKSIAPVITLERPAINMAHLEVKPQEEEPKPENKTSESPAPSSSEPKNEQKISPLELALNKLIKNDLKNKWEEFVGKFGTAKQFFENNKSIYSGLNHSAQILNKLFSGKEILPDEIKILANLSQAIDSHLSIEKCNIRAKQHDAPVESRMMAEIDKLGQEFKSFLSPIANALKNNVGPLRISDKAERVTLKCNLNDYSANQKLVVFNPDNISRSVDIEKIQKAYFDNINSELIKMLDNKNPNDFLTIKDKYHPSSDVSSFIDAMVKLGNNKTFDALSKDEIKEILNWTVVEYQMGEQIMCYNRAFGNDMKNTMNSHGVGDVGRLAKDYLSGKENPNSLVKGANTEIKGWESKLVQNYRQ